MAQDTAEVAALRRFNRFHTRFVGALGGSLHGSGFALSEARVLYELAQRDGALASALAKELDLDPAYLSRILRHFEAAGWLARRRSRSDGRAQSLHLTEAGRAAFAPLDEASRAQAQAVFDRLAPSERKWLVEALTGAQALLSGERPTRQTPVIRAPEPGDFGWIVAAHGRLYGGAYGWNSSFEGLVAEIVAAFLRSHDPARERAFIAELDGEPVGSCLVVRQDEAAAKLRLVLVEARAQGLGLGKALVREALRFAREAGYARMTLWTNDILHAARAIYVAEGFRLVAEERHVSFGHDLVGQNWELDL